MSNGNTREADRSRWYLLVKRLGALCLMILVMDAILFGFAGRLDWLGAWVFSLSYFVCLLIFAVWGTFRAPELLAERARVSRNVKTWDKVLMSLYTVALLALLIVSALDAGRFQWSAMPLAAQAVGMVGLTFAFLLVMWVTMTNTYASRFVRIQDDRQQRVITTGPYRFVRHPMYVGVLVVGWSVPLMLGSWWAFVPGGLIIVLFIIRTALEDRALHAELPGYVEYAARVRYRLVPGVW